MSNNEHEVSPTVMILKAGTFLSRSGFYSEVVGKDKAGNWLGWDCNANLTVWDRYGNATYSQAYGKLPRGKCEIDIVEYVGGTDAVV